MQILHLLSDSHFSVNPPSGKAVFRKEGQIRRQTLELVPSASIDPNIPYPLLNPLQTLFYHFYEGDNAIVSAPTSAGKSLLSYLFFRKFKGRKVYTAPTKALVYEKVVEFRKFYERVDVRTGDRVIENFKEVSGDLVVCTYESLVQAFRNSSWWIRDLSAVVVDEVHQIRKRWVVEELLAYCLKEGICILGLSATIPGAEEFAKWTSSKLLIKSQWRPVPLERFYHSLREFAEVCEEDKLACKLWDALWRLSKPDEKTILFVPQKKLGWKLLEIASKEKVGILNQTLPFEVEEERPPEVAFHNADVPKEEREVIEKEFRKGPLRVLIATQTLAYGVNLPADRVLIMVKVFKNRTWMHIPDELDLLQMEGRAGRLGLKEKGFSHIIVHGGDSRLVEDLIERTFSQGFKTAIQKEQDQDALSFFILLGYLYEGANYRRFLERFYSFGRVAKKTVESVESFLKGKAYIEKNSLTPKGLLCVKSGLPPTKLEEFLRRQEIGLPILVVIRPLLYTKRFDILYNFVEKGESFEEDNHFVMGMVARCGQNCINDNTHQFLFYTEGLTFKYPNLRHPPGEFSYLGTDALHLLKLLWELRKNGLLHADDQRLLLIAHSVKFGLSVDYASLAGVKGIGHIRANLLKRTLQREGLKPPALFEETALLLEKLQYLKGLMMEILVEDRKEEKLRAQEEVRKLFVILENNKRGRLIDDRILLMYGFLHFGVDVLRMKREEIIEALGL